MVIVPRRISDQQSFLTSDDDLFRIEHLAVPHVAPGEWRLTVAGLVDTPIELSLDELTQLPARSVTAFHKCAGNPMDPQTPTPDRVGNVIWSGVSLGHILREARRSHRATHVWASGADHGTYHGVPIDRYTKDLPLIKALSPDVLVAYRMNGVPLSTMRGGPARLVVPGYYGTNSVKWLTAIELADRRSTSPFTTTWYNDRVVIDGRAQLVPVWGVEPDSAIVTPAPDLHVDRDASISVSGWAWGEEEIVSVDVGIDDGETWLASTVQPRIERSWQAFQVVLPRLLPGTHRLEARATDRLGRKQPLSNARNAPVPVEVTVDA